MATGKLLQTSFDVVLFRLRLSLVFVLCVMAGFAHAQNLSNQERELYELIMQYRQQNGLPSIPVSKSLTTVAHAHVWDLQENMPFNSLCNMHSWSSSGDWSSCCYTSDHARAQCMWDKPRELTSYRGYGYEIAHGFTSRPANSATTVTPSSALSGWKGSPGHNAVMLNQGIWLDHEWRAIGIGMSQHHAVVWFGDEQDR